MRRSFGMLMCMAIVAASMLAAAPPVQACSCAEGNLDQMLAAAPVAFVGTAVDRADTPGGLMPVWWTFEVETYLEGDGEATIIVGTGAGDGDCGYDFSRAGRVAVLAWPDRGALTTNSCGGVWPADQALALAGPGVIPEVASPATPDAERGSILPWVLGGIAAAGAVSIAAMVMRRRPGDVTVDGWSGGRGEGHSS